MSLTKWPQVMVGSQTSKQAKTRESHSEWQWLSNGWYSNEKRANSGWLMAYHDNNQFWFQLRQGPPRTFAQHRWQLLKSGISRWSFSTKDGQFSPERPNVLLSCSLVGIWGISVQKIWNGRQLENDGHLSGLSELWKMQGPLVWKNYKPSER